MLRIIFLVLYLTLYLILGLPVLLFFWILGKKNPYKKQLYSQKIVQWGFRCCLFIAGTKITVLGRENLIRDRAVLYVPNHRSFFDILLVYTMMPGLTGLVSKQEIRKIPILRLWMNNIGCLFLDRKDIRQGMKIILTGIEQLKHGISMIIFPEGTRNKVNNTFLPFHGGSFKLSEKSDCPITPVAIYNSGAILEDHLPFVRRASVIVEFGEPIEVSMMTREEKRKLPDLTKERIVAMYEKNQKSVSV